MASLLLGNLGSSLLGPLGGWIGSAIGSYVDNMLFAAINGPQEGPRIEDLNVTRADPGVPIPLVFGADRIPGIVIASTPLIETVNKERVGGKGGPTQTVITYSYHVTIDYMLCEGPILGIARIWAEGNLVRGTRYEMESDTAEFPENIGGIPYPEYYKQHLYDPQRIPWSLNRAFSDSDEGINYIKTPNNLAMVPINSVQAADILANGIEVIYWRDTDTGYYIPLHNDHAYGVSREVTARQPELVSYAIPYQTAVGSGNSNALRDFYTFVDLGAFMDAETLREIDSSGGSITMSGISAVADDEDFGVDVSSRVCNFVVAFYKDASQFTVDGRGVGEALGSDYWQWQIRGKEVSISSGNATLASHGGGAMPIPPETRFIVVTTNYALTFPIFASAHFWTAPQMHINYTKVYPADLEGVRDWPDYWNLYDAINDFSEIAVLTFKGCDNLTVYHGTFDQGVDTAMEAALAVEFTGTLQDGETFAIPAYIGRAHIVFDTLQLAEYGNRVPNFTFEVVQYDDARPAMVLEDMLRRAEVDENHYDLSSLPNKGVSSHVLGYSVGTKTTYRAAMEAIMEVFRIDAAEIGNQIVFRPRDRSYEWEVDWMDLAAVEAGKKPEEIIELHFRDRVEMPRSLTVRFKDPERSYNVNTAYYLRQQGPSVQESMMELAAVMPPANAKAYARDKMRDVWLERVAIKFKLPHKYVYIYPSDIIKINGAQYGAQDIVLKVTSVTRGGNGVLEIEGVMREQTVYVPMPGEVTNTNMDNSTWTNRPAPVITAPTFTVMHFLDIAPLREDHWDDPFGYYGAMGGSGTWRGAGLYASIDAGTSYTQLLTWSDRSVIGAVAGVLPYHRAEFLDLTNTIDVELSNLGDSLETITFDQLIAGFNYCLLGQEVMQFMTAERIAGYPNRWRLSGLNRGRRGTDKDEILRGHRFSERFIMLESGKTFLAQQGINFIGREQPHKVVSFGSSVDAAPVVPFTNTGNFKKPFAPVFIRGVRDSANNLSVQWIRQDRVGWGWYEGQDTYLSEVSWDHILEILNPAGTSVVRTFELRAGAPPYNRSRLIYEGVDYGFVMTDFNNTFNDPFTGDYVYTAAMQTADGYTPGQPVWVRVYKTFFGGRGHPGTARV